MMIGTGEAARSRRADLMTVEIGQIPAEEDEIERVMSDRVVPALHARHLVSASVQALGESSHGAFPVAFDQKQLHDASLRHAFRRRLVIIAARAEVS